MNRLSELVHAKFLEILCKPRFKVWVDFTVQKRKEAQENEKNNALANVVAVMKNSKKGKRSLVDIDILAKFMATITCVPKLSATDMKKLCNELDWVACFGKSLIFLQGDFGAVFYMIAQGSVDLYLETSKDKEMSNARQYGDLRGKTISDDQCTDLGKKIVNLKTGWGFGEMAILSTTHQFRGATAVAAEENSLLLVVHADTYNAVLRKHHFRQAQMSNAMTLLREIPTFNWYSYSKMSQIAYKLKSVTFSPRSTLARAGQKITSVYLVNKGLVQGMVAGTSESVPMEATEDDEAMATKSSLRPTPLYLIQLGRGQLIGQWELLRGMDTFEMTYVTCNAAEVFELNREHFEEVINASKSSFTFKDNPYKIPRWKDRTSKLKAAALVHTDKPPPAIPTAFATYVHGDVFSLAGNKTSNKGEVAEKKDAKRTNKGFVDVEPEKQLLVSAFEGIRQSSLVRQHEHIEKVDRVRHTIQVLTAPVHGDEAGGDLDDLSIMADLRMVLPLVSAYGEDSKVDHHNLYRDPFAPVGASRRNSSASYDSFNTQVGSLMSVSPRDKVHAGESSAHTFHDSTRTRLLAPSMMGGAVGAAGNNSIVSNHQSSLSVLSPRQPSGVSGSPSPRKTLSSSSTHSSRAASGIGALPPNTTAREVFSGAAGGGYQMRLHAPFKGDQTSRASSASSGLDNTIPASHHILRQYESYVNADGSATGSSPAQIPVNRSLAVKKRAAHKVSLALPKVSFVRQTTPGSAQTNGMWTNPSPITSAPPSRHEASSKPQSPFLVNAVSRHNEYDDVYEAERTKFKNEPLLLAAPISGIANSIVSVRRAPSPGSTNTGDKKLLGGTNEHERRSPEVATELAMRGPAARPPPRDKVAASVAHHMSKTIIATKKINR